MGRNVSSIIVAVVFLAIVLIFGLQQLATQTPDRPAITSSVTVGPSVTDGPSQESSQRDGIPPASPVRAADSQLATPPETASLVLPDELPPIEFQGKTREEIMTQVYERERSFASSQGKLAEFEEQERVRMLRREERRRIREEFRERNNALNEQLRLAHRSSVEARREGNPANDSGLQALLRDERTRLRKETKKAMQGESTLN